jgi:hypothetical protein
MNPIWHLYLIGSSMVVLAIIHVVFPKRFKWDEELKKLSLINRQLMEVHTFFIALVVMLNGLLLLTCAEQLVDQSRLARAVVIGLVIFWGCRLGFQFFVYRPELWKGKRFETVMHIFFSVLWTYYVATFIWLFFI